MGRKKIHFEIVSRYNKLLEPATTAVPYGKGELQAAEAERLTVTDGSHCCPAQMKPTAYWEDGSVKWLLVHFLADLPANEEKDYYLEEQGSVGGGAPMEAAARAEQADAAEQAEAAQPAPQVHLVPGTQMVLDNGAIRVELAPPGSSYLFERITAENRIYEKEAIAGPVITDRNGGKFTIELDQQGWEILEAGPVRALVRASGKHRCGDHLWMDFTVMITLWAGKPWLNLDYQFINRERDAQASGRKQMKLNNEQAGLKYDKNYPYEELKEIRMDIRPSDGNDKKEEVRHGIYTSSFNFHSEKASGEKKLTELITAESIVNTGNEMFPEVLFSIFTADWNDGSHALAAGIYQAYQNFPKALDSSGEGITIHLLPDTGNLLKVPQGAARTSRCYLYFHETGLDDRMLVDRAHQFEMMPVPVPEASCYMESGVFGKYVSDHFHAPTERFLYRYVDSRAKGLGMMNFGDGPEWEYIKQGRSGGELIWINNEYDMPHNFMIMLARTGDRRYFDYMKAAVEHWYDVDLCHYSDQPNRLGLLYTHSVDHVSGQPVPSHQWVEGFLDYYHMTGNPNGLEAAMSIGKGLLELMELPIYQTTATVEPREIGWAMRTFLALYRETYEERWLAACRRITEVYIRWADELGTWTTPYPDNYMDRVPFMMHVGIVGLYQYYEIEPEERVKSTILTVVDDIIRHCYVKRIDMFFGKQYPAVRFLNLNGMVLESLAIAYELTGDIEYMKKGLGMFSWITVENQPPIYDFSKYKHDEFTVIYNCPAGPKRCAQTLLPLLHYYRHAVDLGLI